MKKGALFTTIGSIIILIISFIAFVLPSSLGEAAMPEKDVWGKYKDREVKYDKNSDFFEKLQESYSSFQQRNQRNPESNEYYDIYFTAFQNTIARYAYEDAVKKAGYVVPEESVNATIRQIFVDENGNFDMASYKQADQDAIKEYKAQLLKSGLEARYKSDLFGSQSEFVAGSSLYGLKESDTELDFLANLDSEQRAFNLVAFSKADFPAEEILNFANKNSSKFIKYDMKVVTFTEKSVADKAAKAIVKGTKTFEDIEAEYTSVKYRDSEGKLSYPFYYQYSLESQFNNKADIATVSALAIDQVSDVIELESGYAIFKKTGANINPDFADTNMFRDVTTYVNTYEGTMVDEYFVKSAEKFTAEAKATDFDAACTKLNLTKTEVPAFSLNYGGSTFASSVNSTLPGLKFADTNEDFLKTAFTLKEGEYSKPLVMTDDASVGYVIVLQYVPAESNTVEANMKPFLAYQISSYDQVVARNSIMNSKYVENNFFSSFYGFNN